MPCSCPISSCGWKVLKARWLSSSAIVSTWCWNCSTCFWDCFRCYCIYHCFCCCCCYCCRCGCCCFWACFLLLWPLLLLLLIFKHLFNVRWWWWYWRWLLMMYRLFTNGRNTSTGFSSRSCCFCLCCYNYGGGCGRREVDCVLHGSWDFKVLLCGYWLLLLLSTSTAGARHTAVLFSRSPLRRPVESRPDSSGRSRSVWRVKWTSKDRWWRVGKQEQ